MRVRSFRKFPSRAAPAPSEWRHAVGAVRAQKPFAREIGAEPERKLFDPGFEINAPDLQSRLPREIFFPVRFAAEIQFAKRRREIELRKPDPGEVARGIRIQSSLKAGLSP